METKKSDMRNLKRTYLLTGKSFLRSMRGKCFMRPGEMGCIGGRIIFVSHDIFCQGSSV